MRRWGERGVTFLELLVAVVILGFIAVAATNLFFSLLRGGGKIEVGTEVKQNGQYALATIEQLVRNSENVSSCTLAGGDYMQLNDPDTGNNTVACFGEDQLENSYIAVNNVALTSNKVVVAECDFKCDIDPDGLRAPVVTINFTLEQAEQVSEKYKKARAQFSTTVGVRKY